MKKLLQALLKFSQTHFLIIVQLLLIIQQKQKYSLMLYDNQGRLVSNTPSTSPGLIQIERKNLKTGIYLYRLLSNDIAEYSGRVLIE